MKALEIFLLYAFPPFALALTQAPRGALFADSYLQHRSLKWAAVEHAAYGCLIFTLGIGIYFFKHGG